MFWLNNSQTCDFGLTKWHNYSQTKTDFRTRRGTVTNVPPEHWRDINTRCTPKFDVYGFGIMLWELITGEVPFACHGRRQGGLLYYDSIFQFLWTACWFVFMLLHWSFYQKKTSKGTVGARRVACPSPNQQDQSSVELAIFSLQFSSSSELSQLMLLLFMFSI